MGQPAGWIEVSDTYDITFQHRPRQALTISMQTVRRWTRGGDPGRGRSSDTSIVVSNTIEVSNERWRLRVSESVPIEPSLVNR